MKNMVLSWIDTFPEQECGEGLAAAVSFTGSDGNQYWHALVYEDSPADIYLSSHANYLGTYLSELPPGVLNLDGSPRHLFAGTPFESSPPDPSQ